MTFIEWLSLFLPVYFCLGYLCAKKSHVNVKMDAPAIPAYRVGDGQYSRDSSLREIAECLIDIRDKQLGLAPRPRPMSNNITGTHFPLYPTKK